MKKDNTFLSHLLSTQEISLDVQKPYILHLKNNQQDLIYVGSEHTKDSSNKQWKKIEGLLRDLIRSRGNRNTVLFLENGIPLVLNGKIEMIQQYGEAGLLSFLGQQLGIDCRCPEPSQDQITKFVLKRFQPVDFANWISLNRSISGFKGHMEDLHVLRDAQDPFKKGTVLNDVGAEVNRARDYFIAESILESLLEGKSVFAVFGANHVVAQEPIFREYFKKKRAPVDEDGTPKEEDDG